MPWTNFFHNRLPFLIFLSVCLLQSSLCDSERLQVHVISHSHLDLGWVNTVEQYYIGNHTQWGENVKKMMTQIVFDLINNSSRTYCIAEMAFFERWWRDANNCSKICVFNLIANGQLEIVNGGWVGNDEATAFYDDIMQNFISGRRWAKEALNYTDVKIGWQMDSFGTSVTQAYLFKQAGYQGTFFSRISRDDRENRKANKSLEFDWQFPGMNDSIFTHVMSREYHKPILPRASYVLDVFDMNETDYKSINKTLWEERDLFRSNHLLLLFAGDFWVVSYEGLDAMIQHFNNHSEYGIDMFYSTPKNFTNSVKQQFHTNELKFPSKQGDFFPLNDQAGTVWSGFFTSKSGFKGLVRWHSRYLTAVKLFISQRAIQKGNATHNLSDIRIIEAINDLERALSIVQHHDAVSGTMKQFVRFDYEDMLENARRVLEGRLSDIFVSTLQANQLSDTVIEPLNITYDSLLGELMSSEKLDYNAPQKKNDTNHTRDSTSDVLLAAYNPGNTRLFLLTINLTSSPTNDRCITVETSDGRIISPDIICTNSTICSLYFTDSVQAYSWMYYQVKFNKETSNCGQIVQSESVGKVSTIKGAHWLFSISGNTFGFSTLEDKTFQQPQNRIRLSYSYYESAKGDPDPQDASGAYIFNPRSTQKKIMAAENNTVFWVGKHIAIIQIQTLNYTTTLQLLLDQKQFGFNVITQLDPVIKPQNGCEIVMEIDEPELKNGGKFFTDSNGYFMLQRPYVSATGEETPENEIAKNYYPMTTRCSLENQNGSEAFSVFTDRAQGATMLKDKQINILLHRVTISDDGKGVDEILNEKDRAFIDYHSRNQVNSNKSRLAPRTPISHDGKNHAVAITTWHYFLWSKFDSEASQTEREITQYDFERPLRIWLFKVNHTFSLANLNHKYDQSLALPKTVKLSSRTYGENSHSIRIQNLDPKRSLSVPLSQTQDISSVILSLSQNQYLGLKEVSETLWTTIEVLKNSSSFNTSQPIVVELGPLQMRTFTIAVEPRVLMLPTKYDLKKWFGYYLYLHAIVAMVYILFCWYRSVRRSVSLLSVKKEILIVAFLGPFGLGVLWCIKRKLKADPHSQVFYDKVAAKAPIDNSI